MTSSLIETNQLVKTDAGIWRLESNRQFEYTDGDAYENFLKKIVLSTHDRSSQSPELAKKYAHWDWVSEYHLSSQRSNLLRSLDMNGVGNALELGCGCGAITRYIGELDIRVDAIEGAPRRAEIARYRCSDLESVNIINANFNELIYPKETYDAVLLIGVIEYAQKFQPLSTDHRDAVCKILSFAASTVKLGGVIIIAIENRLGLKYWLGASEDHHGRPYTGLYGYPQQNDIRTYDRNEWRKILDDMGIGAYRFAYPFPDYKIPRVVLFDDYIKHDAFAYSSLYGLSSRDYLKPWQPEADEFLIWKSLHESGYLIDFANSFLIVCSDTTESIDRITPNDFVTFSNAARKPVFRTMTRKPIGEDFVLKKSITVQLNEIEDTIKSDELKHPYFKGPLLSTIWLESIADTNNTDSFQKLLKTYYTFVCDYFSNSNEPFDAFDLLPFNIIVDASGSYQVIDKEWTDHPDLSPEYIFFRALMLFAQTNHHLLRHLCEQKDINNVKEFIEYGFGLFNIELGEKLDEFIETEERMQARVIYQTGLTPVRRMIMEPFQHGAISNQPGGFFAQLYWEDSGREFNDKNRIVVSASLGKKRQVLIFNLFYGFRALRRLQLNPVNRPGYFKMFYIALKWIPLNEDQPRVIWQLKSADEIAENALMEGMHFTKNEKEALFLSTCDHPLMLFNLPSAPHGIDTLGGRFQFEVEMDWPKSEDVGVAERLLDKANAVKNLQIQKLTTELHHKDRAHIQEIHNKDQEIKNRDQEIKNRDRVHAREIKNIDRMHVQEIQNKDRIHTQEIQEQQQKHARDNAQIADFSNQVHSLQIQLIHAEASLNGILNSKLWKCLKPLRWVGRFFTRIGHTPLSDSPQSSRSFEVIEKSGLFDPPYYFKQNPELSQSDINPIVHYLDIGAKTGKNPTRFFDSQYYLECNPDVAASGINPLVHYLETGSVNGRSPHPLFDAAYYSEQIPEMVEPGTNPLDHYIETGANTGINPHPLFDTVYYLDQNRDVAESGINPLAHYIDTGAVEGRSPHPLFDTAYYLNQNPDVLTGGINPLIHYMTAGAVEGKNPHPLFDTAYYLEQVPDLLASGINPLMHYLDADPMESKNPHPLFDNRYYLSQHPEAGTFNKNPLMDYLETGSTAGINPHPLFDATYYLDQNRDVAESGVNPLVHYINIGAVQGRSPHPLFNAAYYSDQAPDIVMAGINPLIHYLSSGPETYHNPHPLFDSTYYLAQDPELLSSDINPLVHYLSADPLGRMNPNPLFDNQYYLSQHPAGDTFNGNPLLDYLETGSATGINPHLLFNTVHYLDQHKDIAKLGINPLAHYLDIGALEGRSPHPLFDAAYYLDKNPYVIKPGINPLIHYITTGAVEGENPHPLFDTAYYLEQAPDLLSSGINPLMHYLDADPLEGKNPHPLFDNRYYLDQHPKGDAFSGNPLLDYLETGSTVGINPHPLFGTAYYFAQNKDIAESGINPFLHYLKQGADEDKTPYPLFDPEYYKDQNPDVSKSGINPLVHYITIGAAKKKNPHPLFDTAYYLANSPGSEESDLLPVIHYIEQGASKGKYPNQMVEAFQYKPKISIIRVISDSDMDLENMLHHTVYSVVHQIYGNWELHFLGDFTVDDHTKELLERYAQKDPRIKIQLSENTEGEAAALNFGLSMAEGEYVLFLCDDDQLTVDALYENVKLINENNACDFIYSDEDKMDIRGNQIEGFLDMERQLTSSYHVGHLALFKKSRLLEVGGLKGEHERFYDTDFLLRFLKELNLNRICHIPKQLYY